MYLCYGGDFRIDVVKHVVSQHKVNNCLSVRVHAKVLIVVAAESFAHSVRVVQHRCDSVETESVKTVLFDVPAQVRKQKTQHFVPEEN